MIAFGYICLMLSTLIAHQTTSLKSLILSIGILGQIGSNIIMTINIITLWEWTTPVTRGFMSGISRALKFGLAAFILFG